MQVITAGFCIAGDLAAAVLAGSFEISKLNPQEKSWLFVLPQKILPAIFFLTKGITLH